MNEKVFKKFVNYIYAESGITLKEGKEALLSARIQNRMRVLNIETHEQYLDYVVSNKDQNERVELLDAISTNVTSFFRESDHFELIAKFLPRIAQSGITDIKIWSAACSTGEEPYTIAMTAQDALQNMNANFRILATDISTKVLEKAKKGIYTQEIIDKVPQMYKDKYIKKYMKNKDGNWEVDNNLKTKVSFSRINLSRPPFAMKGPFDLIFCRNVMIYFDNEVRSRLVAEMIQLLRPGGLLLVGHSETLSGVQDSLKVIKASVYRKPGKTE